MKRREFLVGIGAASLLAGCQSGFRGREHPSLALQLYSIHKIFWTRPEQILADLARAGFDGVEFAGHNGLSGKALRKLVSDAGLRAAGTHIGDIRNFSGDRLKGLLDLCAEAGIESCVNPHADFKTADEWRRFGETMGCAAETAKSYGIAVGVHSATHHFTRTYDGVTAWELLFRNASPLLQQQLDVGQVVHTGGDPIALLKRYAGRHHSVHLKENVPTANGVFGETRTDGSAGVPWEGVLRCLANDPSCRWYVIEAEVRCDTIEPSCRCLDFVRSRQ